MKKQSFFILAMAILFVFSPWACEEVSGGYLYGTLDNTWDLYRIDPTDGAAVLVTDSLPYWVDGLAYNSNDGYLYGTLDNTWDLYRIDPTDGAAVLVTDSLPYWVDGLAYVPEPATIVLLGFGSLALLRRRKK